MKGILAILILLAGIGIVPTITQGTEVASPDSETAVLAIIPDTTQNKETAEVVIETKVDRNDDPNHPLPCTPAPNDCSLRQALLIANSDGKPTTITFAEHYVITLAQALPSLTENGTTIQARPEQEVHINGNNIAQSVFYITAAHIKLEGLRIYGAGVGFSNIRITDSAHSVTIAGNIIGDGDAPSGGCGQSDASYGGIYVDGQGDVGTAVRAWIYGNIIECHRGGPGDGITVATNKVIMGRDNEDQATSAQKNIIRWNRGYGVRVGDHSGNVVCNSLMHDNEAGHLYMTNFDNNDVMRNEMR